ncbi:hypothetical protein C8E03_108188 [Lachnotalea glycerini]|uniref:Uncharacterized protein n=1 Tax=Lachnotalea glycerini TaxID=1763509 RepID=A0A318EK52_9FIRM|nr:hypothetical protein [Lachnotalea glycerini]PXV88461.1 hypothetical protein C8E03_108188 [Lachnotalea glycerini]
MPQIRKGLGAGIMRMIYSKFGFNIYRSCDGYIVHNTKKEFKYGHTHLDSFNTAKYIIDMVHYERIPGHLSIYLLISLSRVSNDEIYRDKILSLVEQKKTKKQNYYNVNKGCVRCVH